MTAWLVVAVATAVLMTMLFLVAACAADERGKQLRTLRRQRDEARAGRDAAGAEADTARLRYRALVTMLRCHGIAIVDSFDLEDATCVEDVLRSRRQR